MAAPPVIDDATVDAERRLVRHMLVSTAIAIPVFVGFWVGVVALAVTFGHSAYGAPLLMAVGVGVLAGIFWGTWMGFVSYNRQVDAEPHPNRPSAREQRVGQAGA